VFKTVPGTKVVVLFMYVIIDRYLRYNYLES
jgi:hypothetical protein